METIQFMNICAEEFILIWCIKKWESLSILETVLKLFQGSISTPIMLLMLDSLASETQLSSLLNHSLNKFSVSSLKIENIFKLLKKN